MAADGNSQAVVLIERDSSAVPALPSLRIAALPTSSASASFLANGRFAV
jgi:hypothetical protein